VVSLELVSPTHPQSTRLLPPILLSAVPTTTAAENEDRQATRRNAKHDRETDPEAQPHRAEMADEAPLWARNMMHSMMERVAAIERRTGAMANEEDDDGDDVLEP
jgi:hypothetical protein